jgi:hypothetical protein
MHRGEPIIFLGAAADVFEWAHRISTAAADALRWAHLICDCSCRCTGVGPSHVRLQLPMYLDGPIAYQLQLPMHWDGPIECLTATADGFAWAQYFSGELLSMR